MPSTRPDTPDSTFAELPGIARSMILVEKVRGGDADAFGELLERYQERVRRIVRIRMGARLQQLFQHDDLVQDVFVEAVRDLDRVRFRDHADILRWLSRVAENEIRDRVRAAGRQKRDVERTVPMPEPGSPEAGELRAHGRSPSSIVAGSELRELLDDEVERLEPDDYREVILLRDYQAAEWEDIREALDKPTVAAAQELHRRARLKLAVRMKKHLG